MNDSRPIDGISIEIQGRPTAIGAGVAQFGPLRVRLNPATPPLSPEVHCVIHARLAADGTWEQIDQAFQVIGIRPGDAPPTASAAPGRQAGGPADRRPEPSTDAPAPGATPAPTPQRGGAFARLASAGTASSRPQGNAQSPAAARPPATAPATPPAVASPARSPYAALSRSSARTPVPNQGTAAPPSTGFDPTDKKFDDVPF